MSAERLSIPQSETAAHVWRPSIVLTGLLLLMAVLSFVPFREALNFMWGWWMDRPEFSHGVLMPFLAIFLFWQQRDRFERLPFVNNWWGVLLTIVAGFALLMGKLGSVIVLVQYAYVLTLGGLALSLVGARGAMCLSVPFAILILMVPVPEFVLKNMTADLQLISSKLGVFFIRSTGVSVYLEGNVIDLGTVKLQVAEACSGLRYLFPLMTLGFVMAYFYKASMWKRAFIFLSTIPVTIFMNSLRIGVVGVTVDRWGQRMAEGFWHDFEGWLIFMASTAVLIAEIFVFNWAHGERRPLRETFGIDLPARAPRDIPRQNWRPTKTFLISSVIVLIMVIYTVVVPEAVEHKPQRQSFAEFPATIGEWNGARAGMESVYLEELKLDDYLVSNYSKSGMQPINMYVAWYDSQRGGQSSHSPRTCLPGGGWRITSLTQVTIPGVQLANHSVSVNRALIENGASRQLVYYWFQQRGRIIDNEYVVKWYLFWDSLTRQRTDGAMVRLIVTVPAEQSIDEAESQLRGFARAAVPLLPLYIPD